MLITYAAAERFARSKHALIAGLVIVVGILVTVVIYQNNQAIAIRADSKIDLQKKDSIIAVRDEKLYNCQQQAKITADNQTKAAQQTADKFEKLYFKYRDMKEEVRKTVNQ